VIDTFYTAWRKFVSQTIKVLVDTAIADIECILSGATARMLVFDLGVGLFVDLGVSGATTFASVHTGLPWRASSSTLSGLFTISSATPARRLSRFS
jgi:hypothetical protein